MPDDDRTRRRLGDATKGRIADLASGWTTDPEVESPPRPATIAPEPEIPQAPMPRRKTKTLPPPPPGSAARKALEAAIVDAVDTPRPVEPPAPRTKPPTAPPPARGKPPTAPPPPPAAALRATGGSARPPSVGVAPVAPTPAIVERSGALGTRSGPNPLAAKPASGPGIDRSGPLGTPSGANATKSGPTTAIGTKSGATAAIGATGAKSGPTETGTVSRSGLIVAKSGPTDTGTVARSGVIGERASNDSGAPRALPVPRTPPRIGTAGAPPAAAPGAISRLPLRADPTDVTAASSPAPAAPTLPPMPLVHGAPPRPVTDEVLETIEQSQPGAMPRYAVPLGEFDAGAGTTIEAEKLRIAYEQATIKRDAANAVLGLPEQPETIVKSPPVEMLLDETAHSLRRGDPSVGSLETTRFERGDPTLGDYGDPTTIGMLPIGGSAASKLRDGARLRRKRGIVGDVKYVATVIAGVPRARHELAELEARQELRRESRKRHLITLGRAAATLDGFDHPALGPARERLARAEDERSLHAGAVAAADIELARVRREREAKAKHHADQRAEIDAELAAIEKRIEPLEKDIAAATKRAAALREQLLQIDRQIKDTQASLHSVKTDKSDHPAIHAEIATLRADRRAVEADEPRLAAELDELQPRVASLEGRRAELRKRRTELEKAEQDDQRRSEELLAAIGAKRKVVDRAASDAEALRDRILLELGERLYVDHPHDLVAQLSPVEVIDVELGTGERRLMELREILSSVDKAKLARGLAVGVLALVLVLGIVVLTVLAVLS